jgi:hypothetical protein
MEPATPPGTYEVRGRTWASRFRMTSWSRVWARRDTLRLLPPNWGGSLEGVCCPRPDART